VGGKLVPSESNSNGGSGDAVLNDPSSSSETGEDPVGEEGGGTAFDVHDVGGSVVGLVGELGAGWITTVGGGGGGRGTMEVEKEAWCLGGGG